MSQYTPAGPTGPGAYPPGPPQPAPRRSWFARHKVLTTLGAIVVLAVVVPLANGVGGGGGDTAGDPGDGDARQGATAGSTTTAAEPPAATDPATTEPPAAPAGVGTPVRDGTFEFTVTQVETGVARVGDAVLGEDAQGQFVLLHLTVTNTGDEAQYFDGSSQKLVDTAGRTHSADSAAAIYLDDANSLLNQINPGNTVEGIVVFDVPADAVPASAELHDSPFSGGVTVALG